MKVILILIFLMTCQSYGSSAKITDSPYNADPSGLNDSWTAITNALSQNDTVNIPSGNFLVSKTVFIPDGLATKLKLVQGIEMSCIMGGQNISTAVLDLGSFCKLKGVTVLSKAAVDCLIRISHKSNISISNVELRNDKDINGNLKEIKSGIYSNFCNTARIEYCRISGMRGPTGVGINLDLENDEIQIINNTIKDCGESGIKSWGEWPIKNPDQTINHYVRLNSSVLIKGNHVENAKLVPSKNSIWAGGTDGVTIENNVAKNSYDFTVGAERCKNILIRNNIVTGGTHSGIKLMNGSDPHYPPGNETAIIESNVIVNDSPFPSTWPSWNPCILVDGGINEGIQTTGNTCHLLSDGLSRDNAKQVDGFSWLSGTGSHSETNNSEVWFTWSSSPPNLKGLQLEGVSSKTYGAPRQDLEKGLLLPFAGTP